MTRWVLPLLIVHTLGCGNTETPPPAADRATAPSVAPPPTLPDPIEVPAGIELPTMTGGTRIPTDKPVVYVSTESLTLDGEVLLKLHNGRIRAEDLDAEGTLRHSPPAGKAGSARHAVLVVDRGVSALALLRALRVLPVGYAPGHAFHLAGRDPSGRLVVTRFDDSAHRALEPWVEVGETTIELVPRGVLRPAWKVTLADTEKIRQFRHKQDQKEEVVAVPIGHPSVGRFVEAVEAVRGCPRPNAEDAGQGTCAVERVAFRKHTRGDRRR